MNFVAIEFIDGMTLREHIHHRHSELSKLLRYAFATVYTGLGEKDKAFEAWRSACRKIGAVLAVKVDPIFDEPAIRSTFPGSGTLHRADALRSFEPLTRMSTSALPYLVHVFICVASYEVS